MIEGVVKEQLVWLLIFLNRELAISKRRNFHFQLQRAGAYNVHSA